MPKVEYKKPSLKEFKAVLKKTRGNLTNTAELLGVVRSTLWQWAKLDEDFAEAIKDVRKGKLDQFVTTAELLALGIPDIDPETKKVVGWVEKPDGLMLRYFMSTLGRDEGFGENLDVTTNGKDISNTIQVEIIDKRSDVWNTDEENVSSTEPQ